MYIKYRVMLFIFSLCISNEINAKTLKVGINYQVKSYVAGEEVGIEQEIISTF